MAGRGVHFSLSEPEVAPFRDLRGDARVSHLFEQVEPDYFAKYRERLAESDKAWDAMHRSLTNGLLEWQGGDYPLTHLILGGEVLDEGPVVLVLKSPPQVRDVASALPSISRDLFRSRYDAIDEATCEFERGDEDFEYTWEWFEGVRTFFLKAATEGRFVLFTVDA